MQLYVVVCFYFDLVLIKLVNCFFFQNIEFVFYYMGFCKGNDCIWLKCDDVDMYIVLKISWIDKFCCGLFIVCIWYWDKFFIIFMGDECFWNFKFVDCFIGFFNLVEMY